jgi:hypothetical protein
LPITRFVIILGLVFLARSQSGVAATAQQRADLNIREITSVTSGGSIYRALLGDSEIYPFLVLEKISMGQTEGEKQILEKTWNLTEMKGAGALLPVREGDEIHGLHWEKNNLKFSFKRSSGSLNCIVSKVIESTPIVVCKK